MIDIPFHAGERAMQLQAGSREVMAMAGPRVIRDFMPDQHRDFFALLPFLVTGSIDAQGQPWASMLAAPAGFAHSPDPAHLRIDALPDAGDPLAASLRDGATFGLLGIQPHTRRRNRMNGTVEALDAAGFTLEVQQSFGNCPKYIQAREPVYRPPASAPAAVQRLDGLDDAARALIRRADTLFIASAHPASAAIAGDEVDASARGVDVSHRGGRPGFVRVDDIGGGVLTVPDFTGNRFFNTLGNLLAYPRAGLLFVDFDSGEMLHVAATAEIVIDGPKLASFEGAERLLRLRVQQVLRRPGALPLRWGAAQLSPFLERMGQWAEATA